MSNEFISTNPRRFTGNEKSYLKKGEILKIGQYLFSPDGAWRLGLVRSDGKGRIILFRLDPDKSTTHSQWSADFSTTAKEFFAIMQEDGNLCVYEGSDPQHQGKFLWNAETANKGVRAVMQHDGNFCVYNYDSSTYKSECIVWQAGYNTGFADRYELSQINYLYEKIDKHKPEIETAFTQTLKNRSSLEQKTEAKFTIIKTEKHSWQTNTTKKLGLKASASVKLPVPVEINIEVSGEFTWESAEGKETITQKEMSYTVPVTVPPMKEIMVDACITKNSITLPYFSEGGFSLRDGCFSYCELTGDFHASAGSELNVYYRERDLTDAIESEPIKTCTEMQIDGENQQVTLVMEASSSPFGEPILLYHAVLA